MGTFGSRPLVTAWVMRAVRFSWSSSISRSFFATSASILAVSRSRTQRWRVARLLEADNCPSPDVSLRNLHHRPARPARVDLDLMPTSPAQEPISKIRGGELLAPEAEAVHEVAEHKTAAHSTGDADVSHQLRCVGTSQEEVASRIS